MKAELCPVCGGSGKYYPSGLSSGTGPKTCHGCNGKGWVEVNADNRCILVQPFELPLDETAGSDDKCPACGRPRTDYHLTGCPIGSHWGTYCEPFLEAGSWS